MLNKKYLRRSLVAVALACVIGAGIWHWSRPTVVMPGELRRSDLTLTDGKLILSGTDRPYTGVMFNQAQGGQRLSEIPVQAGIINGLARGWHDNGQLEVEETFVDGKSDGVRKRWYANGKLKSETTIVKGELHGAYTEWHENGQMSIRMSMDHGQPNGTCEAWYPEGGPKSRVEQDHGKIVKQEFFPNKASEVAGQ